MSQSQLCYHAALTDSGCESGRRPQSDKSGGGGQKPTRIFYNSGVIRLLRRYQSKLANVSRHQGCRGTILSRRRRTGATSPTKYSDGPTNGHPNGKIFYMTFAPDRQLSDVTDKKA